MKGISALIKGTTRLPHLCHHIRPQESDSHQTEFFSTLTWTFPASKTMRKKLLLFLSHQRWSPVTAAWTDTVLETNTEPGRKNFQTALSAAHPPPPGKDVPAVLTALLPPPSTPDFLLLLQRRTGSSSQPPHTWPACRPPGHCPPPPPPPALGTGSFPTSVKVSSCHFHFTFSTYCCCC